MIVNNEAQKENLFCQPSARCSKNTQGRWRQISKNKIHPSPGKIFWTADLDGAPQPGIRHDLWPVLRHIPHFHSPRSSPLLTLDLQEEAGAVGTFNK